MSLYSQFATEAKRVEYLSQRDQVIQGVGNISTIIGMTKRYTGAHVATVEKVAHSGGITGGTISFLGINSVDATARTLTVKLYIDDEYNPVFTGTFSTSAAGEGIVLIGAYNSTTTTLVFDRIDYRTTWRLDITDSLSETDKIEVVVIDTQKTLLF